MVKEARWSGWVWVGECFFWYRPTRVVPDQRPLNGRRCCCCCRTSCSYIVMQQLARFWLYSRVFASFTTSCVLPQECLLCLIVTQRLGLALCEWYSSWRIYLHLRWSAVEWRGCQSGISHVTPCWPPSRITDYCNICHTLTGILDRPSRRSNVRTPYWNSNVTPMRAPNAGGVG